MSRERILQIGGIAVLLLAGLLIGWYFNASASAQPESLASATDGNIFRAWFWEHRNLDLLVQVMLIFVGALGVAAVLPKHDETHSTVEPFKGLKRSSKDDDLALD